LAGVSFFILGRQTKPDSQKHDTAGHHNEPSDDGCPSTESEPPPPIKPDPEAEHRKAEREHWERERNLWKHQTWSAWAMVLVTALAALSGIVGLYILNGTLRATRGAATAAIRNAKTAQLQLEASTRPWLTAAPTIASPLVINAEGAHLTLSVVTKNIGVSPAIKIDTILAMIAPDVTNLREAAQKQAEACAPLPDVPLDFPSAFATLTLLPGEQGGGEPHSLTIPAAELADVGRSVEMQEGRRFFVPIIVGCVDYRFAFDPSRHHHTSILLEVIRVADPGAGAKMIEIKKQATPAETLRLRPYFFGGDKIVD